MNNPFDPSQKSYPSGKPVHPLEQPAPASQQRPAGPATPARRVEFPQSKPILTYGLLGINILVFLVDVSLHGQLTQFGAKDNAAIMAGEVWRFITPMFLHAGVEHIGSNSIALFILGPLVEHNYGHQRFAAIYFLSGIAGVITSFAFSPFKAIGASGAIVGLLGASIPLLYRNRKIFSNARRFVPMIAEMVLGTLLSSLSPGVDFWGHYGGLFAGLTLGWFVSPLYKVLQDFDGSIHIKDQSSGPMIWQIILLASLVVAGAAYFVILLRQNGLIQ